ncbi:DUF4390 domain-containing protein [Pelomonas sp. APW6]|uniref:DUF4390 domain-containing protein n=1 Tax=Roseateles subflavus TaxID=3053353 RepID=A0ABT7LFC9_9BURK|nr:DUF4390 domain-containing protein [Pelomonas sp. APW6]MDL5031179.1 DUF4390 domain-containing protein [Pelomonas sp. APW6]
MVLAPLAPVSPCLLRCAWPAKGLGRAVAWGGRLLLGIVLMLALLLGAVSAARAEGIHLSDLRTERTDDGLQLSFSARFELTRPVEEALLKGLPVFFQAEVTVMRSRWYWRDARAARATRSWRLVWQPLTRQYRVTTEGLHQNFDSLPEALAFMRGVAGWRIAEPRDIDEEGKYYLEFSYKLDTSQLPRPMQIGLGAPQGWGLSVEQRLNLAPDFSAKLQP